MNYRLLLFFLCVFFIIFFAPWKTVAQTVNSDLNFSSGSYIPGYTNSKWPSWGKLGSIIGGAPIDPVNRWAGCEGYDDATCWSVVSTTFKCPVFAQMYEYSYVTSTQSYQYHVPFEFIRPTDGAFISQYARLNNLSFSRFCVPETTVSPIGGQCGDGVINVGEQCDPPGRNRVVSVGADGQACAIGSYATVVCNASCQYSYLSSCTAQAQSCGNGIVEGVEECDAGTRNGQYGSRCTTQCRVDVARSGQNPPTGKFCGNGELDRNNNGASLEFCEEVGGVCMHLNSNGEIIKSNVHVLLDRSGSMVISQVPGTAKNRWINARDGLTTIFNDLLSRVNFSLGVFPSSTTAAPCYRNLGEINTTNSSAIFNNLTPTPGIPTPTRCALQQVLAQKDVIFGTNDVVPKKLVLITDGTPSDANDIQTAEIIKQLYEANISTYVIGFTGVPSSTLNLFASAGGTFNPLSSVGDLFFRADRASEFVTAFGEILGCSEYSQYKQHSCSWNCQDYGAYCGDNIVQVQYGEQCDLGNQNGGASCSAYCKLPSSGTGLSVCGNRVVESGEQCDDGNAVNGDGCSSQCRFESVAASCGNGPQSDDPASGLPRLDPGEECDLGSQNGIACVPGYSTSCTYCSNVCKNITLEAIAYCGNGRIDQITTTRAESCDYSGNFVYEPGSTQPVRCEDKGVVTCSNSCQTLNRQCVSCVKGPLLPTAYLSILNPMTQPGKSPYSHSGVVSLYRKKAVGMSFAFSTLGYRYINHGAAFSSTGNTYIDPFQPRNLMPVGNDGLETSGLCNGEYALLYNETAISQAKVGNPYEITPVQIVDQGLGDLFEYSVGGQSGSVTNEVVMSPAVPENQIRVVVRWKKTGNALFTGNMYQDNGRPNNTINYISTSTSGGETWCGEMSKDAQGYYVPTNCVQVGNVWIHKILNPTSTTQGLQAFTFRTSQLMSLNSIGFYVSSPNGPVSQLKDYELWVDVYEHHVGQVPEYSIYKPTRSFIFKNALPSANPLARYWHAFNLKVRTAASGAALGVGYDVVPIVGAPHGRIVTNECEVRVGMPGDTTRCETGSIPFSANILNIFPNTFTLNSSAGVTSTEIVSNIDWQVVSQPSWVTLVQPSSGNGGQSIGITYGANTGLNSRNGELVVQKVGGGISRNVTLTQLGVSTTTGFGEVTPGTTQFTASPNVFAVSAEAGSVQSQITSDSIWRVILQPPWVTSVSPSNAASGRAITINYSANTSASPRPTELLVLRRDVDGAQANISISQAGTQSSLYLQIASTNPLLLGTASGVSSFAISSNVGWNISSIPSWITITNPSNLTGTGDRTVSFSYTANSNLTQRTGVIEITGSGVPTIYLTIRQSQALSSFFEVSPTLFSDFGYGGINGATIRVDSSVGWTVEENDPSGFITITSPSSLSGAASGDIRFNLSMNSTGNPRSGTITIRPNSGSFAPVSIPINQKPQSALSATPRESTTLRPTTSSLWVDIESNVSWTITESMNWLEAVPNQGVGNQAVELRYGTGNPNSQEQGSVAFTITGQSASTDSFIVTQPAVSLAVSSTSVTLDPHKRYLPGSQVALPYLVGVSSNAEWVISNVSYTSGGQGWFVASKGTNAVSINYSTNMSGSQRTGVITVNAGGVTRTIQVTQSPVVFTVPTSVSAQVATSTVEINVISNVPWTVSENTPWITNINPTGGTGNATIVVTYDANYTQNNRNGTLSFNVADQSNYAQTLITQRYFYVVVPSSGYVQVPPLGGSSLPFSVKTDADWGMVDTYPWLTLSRVSANSTAGNQLLPYFGDGSVTVTADPLPEGVTSRSAFIPVYVFGPITYYTEVRQTK